MHGWACPAHRFRQQSTLDKGKSHRRVQIVGIPKLDDANKAGTAESHKCTLILTEGDSAKALAVAGLSELNRDYYGVFPLKGKLLNVREAPLKQVGVQCFCGGVCLLVHSAPLFFDSPHFFLSFFCTDFRECGNPAPDQHPGADAFQILCHSCRAHETPLWQVSVSSLCWYSNRKCFLLTDCVTLHVFCPESC